MPVLTPEELINLTGTDRPAIQAKYLQRAGIGYLEGANGKIGTTHEAVNAVLCPTTEPPRPRGPDFSALKSEIEARTGNRTN